ncbi:MAG: LysR family transcriptional regulator [Pseudomonadota bacterium]
MAGVTLDDLRMLDVVALRRSFRAAADELGTSPSSVSHAVAAVERRLGIRLFHRTTRSVTLTEAGETFLERMRPALRNIADAFEAVNQLRDTPTGTIRINASDTGSQRILPFVLDFLESHPDMRIDLVTDGRMVDIVADGFDAGVRLAEALPQDMLFVSLDEREALIVVGSPDYLASRGTPIVPDDLLRHACIKVRMPSGRFQDWEFERRGEEQRVEVAGQLIAGNPELGVRAARRGAGLLYVNRTRVAADIAQGNLVQVLADWTLEFPGACLYYPRLRLPPAGLAAFLAYLRAATRAPRRR